MAPPGIDLVITIFDVRLLTVVEEVLGAFPVRVGRGLGNEVHLPARSVSRNHGIFTYEPGSLLRYMDLGSTHGTSVDGIKIEPLELVSLRDSNTIEVGPYQLTFHLRRGRPVTDRRTTGPVSVAAAGPPTVSLWKASLAGSEAVQRVRAEHGPSELLRRAAEVIELVAEMIVLCRGEGRRRASPLRSATAPDEIVAYLLSPRDGDRALRELRDLLMDLFSAPPPTGVPA
jgi:hypothetical protein